MKRKLFLMTLAAVSVCVMVACGSKSGNTEKANAQQAELTTNENAGEEDSDENAAPKTKDGVIAMLNAAYKDVNIVIGPRGEDDCEPNIDLVGQYCSKEFNDLCEKIREIEVKKGGHALYEDWFDMWAFWDKGTVTPKDFDVTVDGNTADATFTLTHDNDSIICAVALVYEDGQWHVSDWLQRGKDALSHVERMKEYIEANK